MSVAGAIGITLVIFFWIVALIVITIIWIKQNKDIKSIPIEPNQPMIDVDPSRIKYTDGHYSGSIDKFRENKNGTFYVRFFPHDVKQGGIDPRPLPKTFIVKREFFKPVERSNHRVVWMTFPRDISELPENMRNTLTAEFYSKEGQKAYLVSIFKRAISNGDEALAEMMIEYSRGLLSKKQQQEWDAQLKSLKENVLSLKKDTP